MPAQEIQWALAALRDYPVWLVVLLIGFWRLGPPLVEASRSLVTGITGFQDKLIEVLNHHGDRIIDRLDGQQKVITDLNGSLKELSGFIHSLRSVNGNNGH